MSWMDVFLHDHLAPNERVMSCCPHPCSTLECIQFYTQPLQYSDILFEAISAISSSAACCARIRTGPLLRQSEGWVFFEFEVTHFDMMMLCEAP